MTLVKAGSATDTSASGRPIEKAALASYYLMLAIGCQVRGATRADLVHASKYFAQGRRIAFEKMLEDATVNLVRAFILLAFYMFGACRRNSAFMYLGVAAKSADILGLHVAAQNKRMTRTERDSRLVILDKFMLSSSRELSDPSNFQTEGGKEHQGIRYHLLFHLRKTGQRSLAKVRRCHFGRHRTGTQHQLSSGSSPHGHLRVVFNPRDSGWKVR